MKDTIETAIESATKIHGVGSIHVRGPETKRVRVPGKMVGACKKAGKDVEPCILLEVQYFIGTPEEFTARWLGFEVEFHGYSRIVQSVENPCETNGAILWIETEGDVTISGPDHR